MSDVFISYSRQNQPFVRKLAERFAAEDRSLWVDFDSIPWTADWWDEIRRGIEGCNNFVFVASIASLTSVICTMEVDYALECGKRIIPIVLEDFDYNQTLISLSEKTIDEGAQRVLAGKNVVDVARNNWRYIAQHNWLFFTEEAAFDESFRNLSNAIDADLDYLREHSRLLIRSKEWLDSQRGNSFLLYGDEISAAERWYTSGLTKQPVPTSLHADYIFASRDWANQRQRRQLIGVSIALVVTIVLGFLSVILWQQADRERQRADRQSMISESGKIALEGLLQLGDGRTDLALLLGLEALEVYDSREARSTLLTSLQSIPQLNRYLHAHQTEVLAVSVRPDGSQFVTADGFGRMIVWDGTTYQPIKELEAVNESAIIAAIYSPDNQYLVTAGDAGVIQVWSTDTYEQAFTLADEDYGQIFALAFHPDAEILASAGSDESVYLWNIRTGEEIAELSGHTDWISALRFSPDGNLLASGSDDFSIILWDTSDLAAVSQVSVLQGHTNWVSGLDFNQDGSLLVSSAADGTVQLWEPQTGQALSQPLTDHLAWVRKVYFTPDGAALVSVSDDQSIIVRDPETGLRFEWYPPLFAHSGYILDVAFFPDSERMLTVDSDGNVLLWDIWAEDPLMQQIVSLNRAVLGVGYTPDGNEIFAADETGVAGVWRTSDYQPIFDPIQLDTPITTARLSHDGSWFALARADGTIELFDTDTGTSISTLVGHQAFVLTLDSTASGDILVSSDQSGAVFIWNVETGTMISDPLRLTETAASTAISPDGGWVAVGDEAGQVFLWDRNRNEQIAVRTEHYGRVDVLTFSPDGTMLASAGREEGILLWDVPSLASRGLLLGHEDYVSALSFSADGRLLASGSWDETMILWDVQKRQPIGAPFLNQHNRVLGVAFAPDMTRVVTASRRDGSVDIWTISVADWAERACRIANRTLTQLEKDTYLSSLSSGSVCSSIGS